MITETGTDASPEHPPGQQSVTGEGEQVSPAQPTPGPSTSTDSPIAIQSATTTTANKISPAIEADGNRQLTNKDESDTESTYYLKWIQWNEGKIPIVMQSINGPCPLIATMNVLLLRERVKLPSMLEQITATQLIGYLGDCIMDSLPAKDIKIEAMLDYEQNIHDAIEILPKLKTGLDVNIRFTGITDFEYTRECIIFDLLRIPLFHGWISDQSLVELQNAIGGNSSYNQLVDFIITNKFSSDQEIQTRVLIAEEFLQRTASQLTEQGLEELRSGIRENEIGILFRNNHFLTLFKRGQDIYTLVSDHGYLTEENIIWESLDSVDGAGKFYDSNFNLAEVTNRQVSALGAIDQRLKQLEDDYLIALSLKEEEEEALQQQQQQERERELQLQRAQELQRAHELERAQKQPTATHMREDWPDLQRKAKPISQEIRDRNMSQQQTQQSVAATCREANKAWGQHKIVPETQRATQPEATQTMAQVADSGGGQTYLRRNEPSPVGHQRAPAGAAQLEALRTDPTPPTSATDTLASADGQLAARVAASSYLAQESGQPNLQRPTNVRRAKSDKNTQKESNCRIN